MQYAPKNETARLLRAFIAFCESGENPSNPFVLLPFEEATQAGIPFSVVFSFEGESYAVFITGDASPCEVHALEKAGVIDANRPIDA